MNNKTNPSKEQIAKAMTAEGALQIADSTVWKHGDMASLALKTLAHQYRVMRAERDRLKNRVTQWQEIASNG